MQVDTCTGRFHSQKLAREDRICHVLPTGVLHLLKDEHHFLPSVYSHQRPICSFVSRCPHTVPIYSFSHQ